MAKPRRKTTKGKPITQHQLFPAVVALWFGALFGLGSLAIRSSLLEAFVIKSRIDLLVSAAAPPLGMTARMLIALLMAALGAMIGAWIARRLAWPKQEPRERKRTKLSTRDEGVEAKSFNSYGDASTRNPGPVENDAAAPGVLAGRRRSLAIEHDEGDFVPHDMAPLPGGAPQIFNIAAAGLDDVPTQLAAAAPGSYFRAAPVAPAPLAEARAEQPQMFVPPEPMVEAAAADDRQVFGMAPPATPPSDQPRQIFGAPATDGHVLKEFIEAHGFRSSVFATPEPSALFAPREAVAPDASPAPFPPPVETAAPASLTEPIAVAPAALTTPEPEPALPGPASLGIEGLSARLAEAMRRRRAGRTVADASVEPVLVADASAPEPIPAALRPLDLNGFEEDNDGGPENLLPPRRIAVPPEAAPAPEVPAASISALAKPAEDEPEVTEAAAVAEEDYASLLGVTPSLASLRNPFVRVEEPEAEAEAIEPVVIFPGQSVPPPQPFAQPAASDEAGPTPFRRFDSPTSAGQGQPSAANETANAMPPEEAERALRSALANLQRMSGAA